MIEGYVVERPSSSSSRCLFSALGAMSARPPLPTLSSLALLARRLSWLLVKPQSHLNT